MKILGCLANAPVGSFFIIQVSLYHSHAGTLHAMVPKLMQTNNASSFKILPVVIQQFLSPDLLSLFWLSYALVSARCQHLHSVVAIWNSIGIESCPSVTVVHVDQNTPRSGNSFWKLICFSQSVYYKVFFKFIFFNSLFCIWFFLRITILSNHSYKAKLIPTCFSLLLFLLCESNDPQMKGCKFYEGFNYRESNKHQTSFCWTRSQRCALSVRLNFVPLYQESQHFTGLSYEW